MRMKPLRAAAAAMLAGAFFTGTAAGAFPALAAESAETAKAEETSREGTAENAEGTSAQGSTKTVTLRICSWEEYIDTGDWDEEETIDLPSGDIIGENSMVSDFEAWYEETYGVKVKVEYSTFGTNEDLYNMLTLGDTFDLVCPSEYMFMKLISEDQLVPLSDEFFDTSIETNYYSRGVSPYIRNIFDSKEIDGEAWGKYAAGYMWGITGIVYNPELMTRDEASTWTVLCNPDYKRRVTIKDNVRDSYFAALGAVNHDLLTSEEFTEDPEYSQNLENIMNDTSEETVQTVQDWLQQTKDNVYSFETDSGKADMITGKVVANYQWSGDAVYTMDQADEDDVQLNFAVPVECSNIYFDGWVMLKSGIGDDAAKQQAAEAFINFVSRPDNAIRNMYFIGYTSVISGGEDPRILEYLDWNYGAEEDEEDTVEYDVSYFFQEDTDAANALEDTTAGASKEGGASDAGSSDDANLYILTVPAEQEDRQLAAQYPSTETIQRTSIMRYFTPEQSVLTNQMWINVRCYNIHQVPVWGWIMTAIGAGIIVWMIVRKIRQSRKVSG